MKKIFVSYRRSDSADVTGRILDRLKKRLGNNVSFRDVDSIKYGENFFDVIEAAIEECDVVLVVIGKTWLLTQDDSGKQRLDDPNDYVRREILTALQLKKRVIPILVHNVEFTSSNQLPTELSPLTALNAALIRSDPDFENDIGRLLDQLIGNASIGKHKTLAIAALTLVIIIGSVISFSLFMDPDEKPKPSPSEDSFSISPENEAQLKEIKDLIVDLNKSDRKVARAKLTNLFEKSEMLVGWGFYIMLYSFILNPKLGYLPPKFLPPIRCLY